MKMAPGKEVLTDRGGEAMTRQPKRPFLFCIFAALIFFLSGCGALMMAFSKMERVPFDPLIAGHKPSGEFRYLVSFSEEAAKFKAGFAKKKITPRDAQWLAGYYPGRVGYQIRPGDDLWSKCLVIQDGGGNAVGIASLDLLGFLPSDVREIQERIKPFFSGKILIHTTHTHSAPDVIGLWGPLIAPQTGRDRKYVRFVKNQITSCFEEATSNLGPAMVSFAETRLSDVARSPKNMVNDESLLLMRVILKDRSLLMVNYAVHPDILRKPSAFISSDFLYYVYDYLEKETGSEVMYVNGAIGGVQPKNLLKLEARNDWLQAKELGSRLAQKALEALKEEKISSRGAISVKSKDVEVMVANKKFLTAVELHLIRDERDAAGFISTEVNYIIVGDAGIITFPGEAFPNIALKLKPRMPDDYKFAFGLTNAGLGYILLSPDYYSGLYPYHRSVSLSPVIGDEVLKALEILIAD